MTKPSDSLRCPHCRQIDWSRAPRLKQVFDFVCSLPTSGRTSSDVAERFGLSIANASNQLNRLVQMGLVRRGAAQPHPAGGVFHFYYMVRGG